MKENFKFHWLNPKVEARKTEQCGDGLFAKQKIKKGERVLIVGGYILTVEEEANLVGKCQDSGVQITKDLVICTTTEKEYGGYSFLNHRCEPNAGFSGQIFLVAMRDIEKNEEITIDYAMVLHKASKGPTYKLKCLCGAKKCRGTISENDWKNKDLQKKYKGYFQPYLQNEIDK